MQHVTLRVNIDASWTTLEFELLFRSITSLYAMGLNPEDWLTPSIGVTPPSLTGPQLALRRSELRVRRIQFGSEGFSDFTGVGRVIEAVKDLILGLVHVGPDRASKKALTQGQHIENARNFVKLIEEADALGMTSEQYNVLIRDILNIEDRLQPLANRKQITGAEVLEEN